MTKNMMILPVTQMVLAIFSFRIKNVPANCSAGTFF